LKFRADAAISDSLLSNCRRCNWALDREMTILFGGTEPRGGEEFRSLRSRLYSVRKQQSLKSILVASAVSKEGRTFVAANLARVLALQSGCRVLLIDADLRNPRLHSAFGTAAQPGLSEYLLEEFEEFAVMQRGRAEDLFLIPAGRSVGGQGELVANGRLESLIDRLEPLFDWIIVDSPPAMSVTDACLLSNCCDGVLLVVRSHSTPFDLVRNARMKFREDSLVGVVLNKIEAAGTPRT
jgi:capsular exopolysaccharide synthesis family protein